MRHEERACRAISPHDAGQHLAALRSIRADLLKLLKMLLFQPALLRLPGGDGESPNWHGTACGEARAHASEGRADNLSKRREAMLNEGIDWEKWGHARPWEKPPNLLRIAGGPLMHRKMTPIAGPAPARPRPTGFSHPRFRELCLLVPLVLRLISSAFARCSRECRAMS